MPAAEVVAAAGAAEVEAAGPVPLRVKVEADDKFGAEAADAPLAEDFPKPPKMFDVALEVSGAAEVDIVAPPLNEPNSEAEVVGVEELPPKRFDGDAEVAAEEEPPPKRFGLGADEAGVEELAPKRDGADCVLGVSEDVLAAAWDDVGVGEVSENVGAAWGADETGVEPNRVVEPEEVPLRRLPTLNPDEGAVAVVVGVVD